jgi:hypothetical protein
MAAAGSFRRFGNKAEAPKKLFEPRRKVSRQWS